MSTGRTAREMALLALTACEQQGAWSDGFLKKAIRDAGLDGRDAGLATRLCFGVLQNRMLLDFHLSAFCKLPLETLEVRIRNILRLGAYQLLLLDRVPDSAAVNESVNLARKYSKNPRAAGMVNAVLRNLARSREDLPQPADLATRFSHPDWLVKEFDLALGEDGTEALLAADNGQPPTMAQVNTLRYTPEQVLDALRAGGVDARPHPWLPGCLLLTGTGDLEGLAAFRDGAFYIQDGAARLAVLAAGPEPGMRVLDACAAPGGKSFAAAIAMENRGEIWSCDIHPHKETLIRAGARRLGLDIIHTAVQDGKARRAGWEESFDLVIADVPCSGLGIIRKKPDIRYKAPEPLAALPAVQSAILDNVAGYVRPGGVLLYSTCTLLERENGAVVDGFLAKHSDFTLEPFQLPGPFGTVAEGRITLWPHLHDTDGFYMARLRKRG
ncbi:MAG: 16S rRNA (cytosine(967)-C(5))-methyltransferase RsmB [Clostridiales bacterium]|nr:16S rRNA (cytosine(967)-C(5))-methyltransferase RsmB [Clostridiales bacterium]MDY4180640.1 16S rRNA (cytosine(967)-C(5))-methyltransferase RsmB [Pseudoflavonifractor sp.]